MGEVWWRRELVTLKYPEPTGPLLASLIPSHQNQIRLRESSIEFPKLKASRASSSEAASNNSNENEVRERDDGGKNKRGRRGLIRVSTAEGKWKGNWNAEYVLSLRDLNLQDLAENGDSNSRLSVSLSISRHTGFGLSVDGRITTSFIRRCSNCSSPYCREINSHFNVWVLPSRESNSTQLPEIGGDDPSVIYVKQGCEADLDSLVQDTMRLTTSVNETCSESCAKSELRLQHPSNQNSPAIDKRWSKLLELRDSIK